MRRSRRCSMNTNGKRMPTTSCAPSRRCQGFWSGSLPPIGCRRQFECQTAHSRKAQRVRPTTLRSHAHLRWVLHRACGSSQIRGRRESRAPDAPAASHAEKKHTSNRHHRYAERSGLPCAMVLRLIFALSLVTGLSCHHPRQNGLSILAALTPASGCQDHTTSPSAASAFVFRASSVHRIPPPRS